MDFNYDIIVAGGGPSGVCAAVAAARGGAKVLLVEEMGFLGGVWTSGLVSWFMDTEGKEGIIQEIMQTAEKEGVGRMARDYNFICEHEPLKFILDRLCIESGVTVLLYTKVTEAVYEGRILKKIVTYSKSGRQEFSAKLFIDATGDGDLCAMCGCGYSMGRPEDGKTQPLTMMALIGGMPYEEMINLDNTLPYDPDGETPKDRLYQEIVRAGTYTSQKIPALYHLYENIYLFTANHEFDANPLDNESLTRATLHAREEVNRIVCALRESGGRWKNIRLIAASSKIGVRDSRRVEGLYSVTQEDINCSRRHSDSICTPMFPIDIHAVSAENKEGYEEGSTEVFVPYDIPLRAAIAKDMDNLMMSGRCISGDFHANASFRVTGNATVIGENVGRAAAEMIKKNVLPHDYVNQDKQGE